MKWISVKERQPENGKRVLVCIQTRFGPEIDIIRHLSGGRFLYLNRDEPITHWMPLPEPPKEGRYNVNQDNKSEVEMMSREEKRAFYSRVKKASYREFWALMNEFHTRAYQLAEQHYQEAMDIVLTPKKKTEVVAKAKEIRELWDGIYEVTVDVTGGDER